jgi:anti-sigma factor RsiW
MSPVTSKHDWLRRVSDYHSGGVSDGERVAVEAHLATCQECQAALATYRRFDSLLRSPLRLAPPAASLPDDLTDADTLPHAVPPWPPRPGLPRRPRTLAGVAAVLAATLVVAGFVAVYAARLSRPTVARTPTAQATVLPTVTPSTVPTVEPTATQPAPAAFVCANPQGSSMTYVYQRADGNLYAVTGCGAPRQLTQLRSVPIAWSPSNRYLAVNTGDFTTPDRVSLIDVQTGATAQTSFAVDFGSEPQVGQKVPIFFDWLDDNTFLGGNTTITQNPQGFLQPGPTTLVRVQVTSGKQAAIGTIPGWANFGSFSGRNVRVVASGRYVFYVGYDSAGRTGYLHRFDLTTGANSQLVSLGLYTYGGCQVSNMCGWTAPWDVSPDGSHILYHNPGADSAPSDTHSPRDTPVYYANPDGSGASQPFGTQLAVNLVSPIFSSDGIAAVASGSKYSTSSSGLQLEYVRFGGAPTIVNGSVSSWRGDSQALVIFDYVQGILSGPSLYDLGSRQATSLEANSNFYLWAH